jgi:hypothetical protein
MNRVEKITRLTIKEAFRYEARDLTPWLCENIDVLGDAIGLEILNPEREQSTGNFNVDIKAESATGEIVVIENQFGQSDHDHLGKLITYLTSFEAKIAIWIVEKPKQEHINALNWLNETDNGCDFYLLSIEAIRIGESNPAPLLTTIVRPSEEAKSIGKIKKVDSQRHNLRKEFWALLLDKLKQKGAKTFSGISPTSDSWIGATSGIRGLTYVFWLNQKNSRLELRIDRGKGSEEENLQILNELKKFQGEIESQFGGSLNWEELEGYRVCSIRLELNEGGYTNDNSDWDNIANSMATQMTKLIEATQQYIKKLNLK